MEGKRDTSGIQIVEKPDWVSWEDIKRCLYEAHSSNRDRGINMSHYQWPAEKFIESIGGNGKMFIATDNDKLVGVGAVCERNGNTWYAKGKYAYLGFAGVLPEYKGQGIYKELIRIREDFALRHGYDVIIFDTHKKNISVQKVALKNGFRYVRFFQAASKDHYSVVLAKWIHGCPHSKAFCFAKYQISKFKTLLFTKVLHR